MRYELHGATFSDISWAANNGIDALGLIATATDTYDATLAAIHSAGMEAGLNVFNNGEAPLGSSGEQYDAYIQDIAAAGWDYICGDSVAGDVVNTIRKYIPFVNHAGDIGGFQLRAWQPPWNHPVDGTYPHHDYIYTWVSGSTYNSLDSTVAALAEAAQNASAVAGRLGVVISSALPSNVGTWVRTIEAASAAGATVDTVVLTTDITSDVVDAVQTGVLGPILTQLQAVYPPNTPVVVPPTGTTATAMTATNNATSPEAVNTSFSISGTLKTGGVGLGSKTISIYRNDAQSNQSLIATPSTDGSGNFAASESEAVAGNYSYSCMFAGDSTYDTSSASTSVTIATQVIPPKPVVPIATSTHPVMCSGGANTLDVFCKGGNTSLYHVGGTGSSWGSWADLSTSTFMSSPGCCAPQSGQLVALVRGNDSALYSMSYYSGAWHAYDDLGGTITYGPGGSAYGNGVQDIYVVGTTGALWHMRYIPGSGYSVFQNLGGICYSEPAATSPDSNHYAVYVRNSSGTVSQAFYGGSWGWTTIGGANMLAGTGPGCCSGGSAYHIFANVGNSLYHTQGSGGGAWSGWENIGCPIGGAITSSPSAAMVGSTCHVVARGNDKAVWHISGTTGAWGQWASIGGLIP